MQYVNLHDFGATGEFPQDVSSEFAAALQASRDQGLPLYVPPGVNGGRYRIADVYLQSGDHIVCAPSAIIRGVDSSASTLLRVVGSAWRISITGGKWQQCGTVMRHEVDGEGKGTLSSCRFSDLLIGGTNGFVLDVAVGVTWSRCESRTKGGPSHWLGVQRQCNVLRWDECTWITGGGIVFDGGGSLAAHNAIERSWFEAMDTSPLRVKCQTAGLLWSGNYSERNADAIALEGSGALDVEKSRFAAMSGTASAQVLVSGQSSVRDAGNNNVVGPLVESQQ